MPLQPFEFATAARIVFGAGSAERVDAIAAELGARPFRVGGSRSAHADFRVAAEPDLDLIRAGVAQCREAHADVVIATGGGSALDAAKAIAILATNPGDPLEYLEVVGRALPFSHNALPCVAVPTTAGTGSEVTRNAVLGSPEHGVKASLRHASMLPRVAVLDPVLTLDLPCSVTVASGLDALTQLIEPYVSARANPLTDAICLDGIRRVATALPRAVRNPADIDARSEMLYASLLGGIALSNAGLGVIHGFAGPVGGRYRAPHGAVCAALLPYGVAANLGALREQGASVDRYANVGAALTGRDGASADDAVTALLELCGGLGVPGLATFGITEDALDSLAAQAAKASSMKANPVTLRHEQLVQILRQAL
jgi:alcohol dehydrogenase class IV